MYLFPFGLILDPIDQVRKNVLEPLNSFKGTRRPLGALTHLIYCIFTCLRLMQNIHHKTCNEFQGKKLTIGKKTPNKKLSQKQ